MKKTIWYIHEYNQIPSTTWRKSRSTIICETLSKKYNVFWWTASFDHHTKTQRPVGEIIISDSFKIVVVKTSGYKKNVSLKRFARDKSFARNMKKAVVSYQQPDLIITCGNPFRYCEPENILTKDNNIPVIVDMNDIWPDIIEMAMPRLLKPLIHLCLLPMYKKRNSFYRRANAFISTGSHHLNELISMPGDNKERMAACVYNGIDVKAFRCLLSGKVSDNLKIPDKQNNEIWCIFSGTLGSNYDIELIIKTAEYYSKNNKNVKFFITGNGPLKEYVEKKTNVLNNLRYLGIISYEDLVALYGKCDIGLAPYKVSDSIDMPDKLFDYFAAGLATICSLNRDAGYYISKFNTGEVYQANSFDSFISKIDLLMNKENLYLKKQNSFNLGEMFDVNKQMEKVDKIVDELLAI